MRENIKKEVGDFYHKNKKNVTTNH